LEEKRLLKPERQGNVDVDRDAIWGVKTKRNAAENW